MKDLHQPLLGGPALEALDLIKKDCVNAVNSEEKTDTEYKQRYSKLFKGLGKCQISIKFTLSPMKNHLLAMYPEK